jgi:hypothetical protein
MRRKLVKKLIIPVVLLFTLAMAAVAYASTGYPWNDHAAPYDYLFGNHIDTHLQSQTIDKNKLEGFFYIQYTGNVVDGVPEAMHANCGADEADCFAGWKLNGLAVQATLLEKPEGMHPQWCVDLADIPRARGYSHFHWEGLPEHAGDLVEGATYDGYLLKLTAIDRFFFEHHGGFFVTPGIDTETHANVVTDC